MQERLRDFKVTIEKVYGCGFHIALTFKKLPLIVFWYDSKEDYPQLSEKVLQYSSLFQLCMYRFSSYSLTKQDSTTNVECGSRYENTAVFY